MVPKSPCKVAPTREIGKSSSWTFSLLATSAPSCLQWQHASRSVAFTATAVSTARYDDSHSTTTNGFLQSLVASRIPFTSTKCLSQLPDAVTWHEPSESQHVPAQHGRTSSQWWHEDFTARNAAAAAATVTSPTASLDARDIDTFIDVVTIVSSSNHQSTK